MDFRKHKRKQVELVISYAGEQIAGQGTVCDLSQAGCGVVTKDKVPVGSFLEAQIQYPGQPEAIRIEVAVVRYCIPNRFGLDFLKVNPPELQKLKQLVKSF